MAQITDNSIRQLPSLKFAYESPQEVRAVNQQHASNEAEKNKLENIVKKYRLKQYIDAFRQKIKRNNIYQTPAYFELEISNQRHKNFLHIQGIEIKSKAIESFIFAGDIIFTLIVFYILVFQAFLEGFRNQKSSSLSIILIKIFAIAFEFSKILIKSIKKDIVNGKVLTHIDDILWNSTGIFQLILYISAITMILLTIIYPLNNGINVASFMVATIKLFKIPMNLKVLDLHYINSHRKQCYWNLIKVIIFELIFMHFVAAILLAMSSLNAHNWLVAHKIDSSPWDAQYFWAMYWSATLITTTGFGDFVATNTKEALIVAFLQLFSSVVLAYNLNLIGNIVMSLRNSDQSLQKRLAIFRRMSDQSPVSHSTQQKIHSYIDHQRQINENFEYIQRKTFLEQLPEQLKAEYENDVNQTIFHQLPFFGGLRLETLNNLATQFSSKVCYPGENLIPCRQETNNIHILRRGQICFHFHKFGASFMNQSIIETIQTIAIPQAKPILLNNTFMNRSREINFDIKAHDYSLIMSLSQFLFMETIRKSDIQKQHFFTIYDKHQNNFIFEATKCPYCTDEYHNKFECPKLHFMPFKLSVVRKYLLQTGKKQGRIRCIKQSQRKEHCYYLRKSYYQAYEGYKNIIGKNISPDVIHRLIRMKTLAEKFDRQDLLESFQNLFRKVINNEKNEFLEDNKDINVDALHNYLSYFIECNPKELDLKHIKKKVYVRPLKLNHKLTLLAVNSKKHLYRYLNQFDDGSEEEQYLGQLIEQP